MDPLPSNGPLPFNPSEFGTDVGAAFDKWIERFEIFIDHFLEERPPNDEPAKVRYAKAKKKKLLWFIGENGLDDVEALCPNARTDDSKTFDVIVQSLKRHYQPKSSRWQAIVQLRALAQEPGEPISKFAERCRRQAALCGFDKEDFNERNPVMLGAKIQLVLGTSDRNLRDATIQKNWTYDEIVKNGMLFEDSAVASNSVTNGVTVFSSERDFDVMKMSGPYSKTSRRKLGSRTSQSRCMRCGSRDWHPAELCPAKNKTCSKCNKLGHFAIICKSSQTQTNPTQPGQRGHQPVRPKTFTKRSKQVRTTTTVHDDAPGEEDGGTSSEEEARYLRAFMVRTHNLQSTSSPQVHLQLNGTLLTAVADSGAQINVIPMRLSPKSLLNALKPTKVRIKPYGASSDPILPIGVGTADVTWGEITLATKWYVVEDTPSRPMVPLISCDTCVALGILTINLPRFNRELDQNTFQAIQASEPFRENIQKGKFRPVFQGVGLLKGHEVELHLVDNPKPVACAPRYEPFHLKAKVERVIQQMLLDDIIEPHEGPSPWVSNIQVAPKDNGEIRITIDLRNLNKCLVDTRIPIPTIDSIKAELVGCKFFSKLDFKASFHQLTLAKPCRSLTVFRVGAHLYRFKRLPMGVKPASGEFMRAVRKTFSDIPGLHALHDDVIIAGTTKEKHDQSLRLFLERLLQTGMTLNPDKCVFGKQEIPFWGMLVTSKGVKPDPERVRSLRDAPTPQNIPGSNGLRLPKKNSTNSKHLCMRGLV